MYIYYNIKKILLFGFSMCLTKLNERLNDMLELIGFYTNYYQSDHGVQYSHDTPYIIEVTHAAYDEYVFTIQLSLVDGKCVLSFIDFGNEYYLNTAFTIPSPFETVFVHELCDVRTLDGFGVFICNPSMNTFTRQL